MKYDTFSEWYYQHEANGAVDSLGKQGYKVQSVVPYEIGDGEARVQITAYRPAKSARMLRVVEETVYATATCILVVYCFIAILGAI
jgi:hypothetical protein